jgi:hypothetical protein
VCLVAAGRLLRQTTQRAGQLTGDVRVSAAVSDLEAAEMQITGLHLKLDDTRTTDLQAVVTFQRRQLELLERIERALSKGQS